MGLFSALAVAGGSSQREASVVKAGSSEKKSAAMFSFAHVRDNRICIRHPGCFALAVSDRGERVRKKQRVLT